MCAPAPSGASVMPADGGSADAASAVYDTPRLATLHDRVLRSAQRREPWVSQGNGYGRISHSPPASSSADFERFDAGSPLAAEGGGTGVDAGCGTV